MGSRSFRLDAAQPPSLSDELPPQEENAAAASIDILAQQFLLQRREVVGRNRADDDAGVAEEIFGAHRKTLGQLARIADALAVNLVLAGAQHGDDLHRWVIVFRAADEFVLPARLAFDIEDAALRVADEDRPRDRIVGEVLFAGQRFD